MQVARPGWFTDAAYPTNATVARLRNASGFAAVGPHALLKVMAGDQFNLRVAAGYASGSPAPAHNQTTLLNTLLSVATNTLAAASGGKATATALQSSSMGLSPALNTLLSQQPANGSHPRAYLAWILFDEQFKIAATGATQVTNAGTAAPAIVLNNVAVGKSGYLYVYTSNESSNVDVLFDNLQITHTQGPLLEETHYYPFGLTMAGISSRAVGILENKRKWNAGSELASKEFSDGSGLELYETFYRSLDPQIGRFWQIDPKPNYSETPYASMGNNPISNNDPLGDTLLNQADHRRADRIEKQIHKTNASLNKKATKLNSKIAAADAKENTAKADRRRGKLADVNARIATNTNTLGNLNAIRNDQTQAYTFNQLPAGSTEGGTMLKTMKVNGSNQSVVVMNVLSDANAVHELTHAVQGAIQNMFTFNLDNAANPVTFRGATIFAAQQVNANSEVAAYQAQYAFSPGSLPSSTMGGVPGSMNNIDAIYVGGLNGTNAAGTAVPIYPNVQNMVNTTINIIFHSLRVAF